MNLLEAISYTKSLRQKQYSTGKVGAIDFKYLPREKQLYITAQAVSSDKSRMYKTTLVFEGIKSSDKTSNEFPIPFSFTGNGIDCYLNHPAATSRIRTRCSCQDYYFMWSFWNKNKKALVGPHKTYVRVPGSTRPPVNPDEIPGLCKHLLKMINNLMSKNIIKKDQTIWSYVNQSPRD